MISFTVDQTSSKFMSVMLRYSQQQLTLVLNSLSSMSGSERYSSSTKSTNDERVVFSTLMFFSPLIIVGRKSEMKEKDKCEMKNLELLPKNNEIKKNCYTKSDRKKRSERRKRNRDRAAGLVNRSLEEKITFNGVHTIIELFSFLN